MAPVVCSHVLGPFKMFEEKHIIAALLVIKDQSIHIPARLLKNYI